MATASFVAQALGHVASIVVAVGSGVAVPGL